MIHIYLFSKEKFILISDKPKDKLHKKYGHKYEIMNSFKDKQSIYFFREKLQRQSPTFNIVEDYYVKKVHSVESKKRMSLAKKGTKLPDKVKQKIAASRKGVGNFSGKKHSSLSKTRISHKMSGKKQVEGKKLIYNPSTDKERRVENIINLPNGFRRGRDPEVIDSMHYGLARSRDSK